MPSDTPSVEALDRRRHTLLLGALLGFLLWQVARMLRYTPYKEPTALALGLEIGGWAVWTYCLVQILRFSRLLKKQPSLNAALNDERVRLIRSRTMAFGFWGLLLYLLAIGLLHHLGGWSPAVDLVSDLGLLVGVTIVWVTFLFQDRG